MNTRIDDGYVLGRNEDEYRRLLVQAEIWAPATRSALQRAGLSSGMRVLDVGCGPGSVMRLMAERVGNEGRVTGIDVDAALGAQALSHLRAAGPDIFDFVAADIAAPTQIDEQQFDFVFARLVLLHAADPLSMLDRLWRWVRPGGVMLVMDYDMTGIRTLPAQPLVQEGIDLVRRLFTALGRDVQIGSHMPALMRQAGVGSPDGCDVWSHVIPNSAGVSSVRAVLASLRQAAIAGGHVDAPTLDRLEAGLACIPADQFHVRHADMVATWKRKHE